MCTRHSSKYVSRIGLEPPSLRHSLLGVLIGCALLALATWLGNSARMQSLSEPANPLHIVDASHALVFDAEAATGDVRVLNVRNGVSEIARLHDAQRGSVTALSLDPQQHVLTVESSSGRYQYDTLSFRLLSREPLLAAGPSNYPAAD
ncbi:MAG: hypothetical protein JWN23_317 [Rhodocyclales bacterium]|nr:hypothetical protein [Rhodocyclales bacterium]